ncbi:hypothetical protein [Streptomyces oceani]|uniref:Uncharacterized protein n=1 Tax=Streptomyces oceani TaxID=1075402 RepID=A0A1E7KKW3_9ACTN|nr:hypothetical protein [Streptomyces oceani]OEV04517.1 hypothetical protein AN216_06265 [Streptomyces oceani]
MTEGVAPLVALIGFKRSKWAWMGGHRVLTVRDGRVRVLGRKGVDLDVPVREMTARLTRARAIEVRAPEQSAIIFGVLELGNLHTELRQILVAESEGAELIGPAPTGFLGVYSPKAVTGQAQVGRAITEALHARGVGQG